MRPARIIATGLYLFGLAAGALTLGGGCGGDGGGSEVLVPAKTEVSPEEKQGRMEAMKKAEAERRKSR